MISEPTYQTEQPKMQPFANKNPSTRLPYVDNEPLPVHEYTEDILKHVAKHRVTVIHGETGSGKTTVIPRLLLLDNNINSGSSSSCSQQQQQPRIIVTQPRRIACLKTSERVKKQLEDTVYTVGHRIMNDVDDNNSHIVFCTTGYLVQWFSKNDKVLENATHIILDECHERSVDMDLLALLIKRKMKDNPNFKIIVMSATIDVDVFGSYFEQQDDDNDSPHEDELAIQFHQLELASHNNTFSKSPPKVLSVGTKRYPVKHLFLEDIPNEPEFDRLKEGNGSDGLQVFTQYLPQHIYKFESFVKSSASGGQRGRYAPRMSTVIDRNSYIMGVYLALHFHGIYLSGKGDTAFQELPGNCVLVFLPGENEILEWLDIFDETIKHSTFRSWVNIFVLHSMVGMDEQKEAFENAPTGHLKIVLCTNIAESSITIPDVGFVLDYGLRRQMEYNSMKEMEELTLGWISKASSIQRLGRCGRTKPGVCVTLMTRSFLNQCRHHEPPELAQISLEGVILRIKDIFRGEPSRQLFRQLVEPPGEQQLLQAYQKLVSFGAVGVSQDPDSDYEGDITYFGEFSAPLPCGLMQARVLMFGQALGMPVEGVILAAALITQDVFTMPSPLFLPRLELESKLASSFAGRLFADNNTYSEPIMVYNLFIGWCSMEATQQHEFLHLYAVHATRFRAFRLLVAMLARRLLSFLDAKVEFDQYGQGRNEVFFKSKQRLEQLMKVAQKSFRDKVDTTGLFEEANVDKLREILLFACSPQLAISEVTDNHHFHRNMGITDQRVKDIVSSSKRRKSKKQKAKKSALEKELAASLFKTERQAQVTSAGVPFAEYVKVFRTFVKDNSKEFDESASLIGPGYSVVTTYPKEDLDKPFNADRTVFIKFISDTKPEQKDANKLLESFAWAGVERVITADAFAAFEFSNVDQQANVDNFGDIGCITAGVKFLDHLTMGRGKLAVAGLDVAKKRDCVNVGTLIMPTVLKWKARHLSHIPRLNIRFNWRAPVNSVVPSKNISHMVCVSTSQLALSNGMNGYDSVISLGGVTLIPHEKEKFKLLLLASFPRDSVLEASLVNPDNIADVRLGSLVLDKLFISTSLFDRINQTRLLIDDMFKNGKGILTNELQQLVDSLEVGIDPKSNLRRAAEFTFVDVGLGEEDGQTCEVPLYGSYKWPEWQIWDEGETSDEDECSDFEYDNDDDSDYVDCSCDEEDGEFCFNCT